MHRMDAHAKLLGHLFSGHAIAHGAPNLFDRVGRQLLRFFKHGQRVSGIPARRNILQVIRAVVDFIAVFMVNVISFWTRAYKSCRHQTVNCFMSVFVIYRQSYKKIPVASARGFQNANGVFVGFTTQNFADNWLAHAKHRGYFSRTYAFGRQAPHFFYINVVEPALRKIWRTQTAHTPFVAYLVGVFETDYIAPRFHLQTPVS